MIKIVILIQLIIFLGSASANTAVVIKIKGNVLFNGKKVKLEDALAENGILEVTKNSYIKLKVEKFQSLLTFAPGTKLKLDFKKNTKKTPYTLLSGSMRWLTTGKKAQKKGVIKTRSAIFGVRGTDFLIMVNPLLNESEIVCFDGEVLFVNKKNSKDRKSIKENQWGGLGGRFGKSIGPLLTLPKNIIEHFKSVIE
jgi:hypothetical protein